jgi:hypothetical protein
MHAFRKIWREDEVLFSKPFRIPSGYSPMVSGFFCKQICHLLLLVLTLAAFGHAQGIKGTITGTVKDPNDAPLTGVKVTLVQAETNARHEFVTSSQEIPSIDALDQLKMITNGAPAEFNQQAQIIVTTKSGTNQFHGEALEFNRSKGTGAKAYTFTTPATTAARPPYERNEYGGNFSGPIIVPHLYDGRDKSFFFFAYEGFSYTYSSSANTFQPTDKMRSGDFSDFLFGGTCYTGKAMNLVNPVTKVNYTTTNGNKIPTADQNTTSLALLNLLYPHATNQNVCSSTNTYETIGYSQAAKRFSARLDHKLSEHDQLRATFMHAFYGPYAASWTDSLAGGYGGIGEHDKYAAFRVPEVPLPSCLTPTFGALSCNPSGKFCIACA